MFIEHFLNLKYCFNYQPTLFFIVQCVLGSGSYLLGPCQWAHMCTHITIQILTMGIIIFNC